MTAILHSYLLPGGRAAALLDSPQPFSVHKDLRCDYSSFRSGMRTFGWMSNIDADVESARTIADSEEFRRGLLWVFAASEGAVKIGEAVACYLRSEKAGYRFGGCSMHVSALWCDPDGQEMYYWNPSCADADVRRHIESVARELQV